MNIETKIKDHLMGKKDRLSGYYDKWYRWNRADDGRAYDAGVKEAIADPRCVADVQIIECMH